MRQNSQFRLSKHQFIISNLELITSITMLSIKKLTYIVKEFQHRLLYRAARNVSSRKFHELAEKIDKNQMLHSLHENNIITKYLAGDSDGKQSQHKQYHKVNKLSSKQKTVNYQYILARSPRGSILNKDYKQSQLCLFGMNYTHTSYDTLYKAILKFQPDCVLIHNKPESFVSEFEELKKNPSTGVFSDRQYVKQLDMMGNEQFKRMFMSQEGKNMLMEKIFPRKSSMNKLNNKINVNTANKNSMIPNLDNDLLQQKPLLASIYYSLHHHTNQQNNNDNNKHIKTPIYLTELPQRIKRQWLANSNTLMQLQQLLKQTCKSLPLYPGTNITPYQLACFMFPEQFMGVNDLYMATMVEIMLALGYKRLMLFCPTAANQAIWEILQNNLHCDSKGNIKPIIQSLIPPQVKGSLIRNIDPLELIQKHILLDSLFYGFKLTTTPISKFTTTNQIINHYAKEEPKQMMFKFRYEMCMKYSEMITDCVKEGEERKRKEFMRTVMRQ